LRFLAGDPVPPILRGRVARSGDGVGTAVDGAVVSPVAEGAELATESLRFNPADDTFNSEVTSMVTVGRASRLNSVFGDAVTQQ
jgi:hypothetical protein